VRIGIANDSPVAVEAVRRVLVGAGHDVAWVARDGVEAVAACRADVPDLVLMDLRMPNMGGVECTRRIMADSPCAILVVTATVAGNYSEVYDALGAGALDAVNTPVLGRAGEIGGDAAFLERINRIAKLVGNQVPTVSRTRSVRTTVPAVVPPLVVLGASTGGPEALARILAAVPAALGAAIVIIQHIDRDFAPGLATWLTERTRYPTEVLVAGAPLRPGVALVPATNDHVVMTPAGTIRDTPHPRSLNFRPSVDVFFSSVADTWPARSIAAVLTGMGRDGADGLLALRTAGWTTIAQDEASSVVFGMPRAAIELRAATETLPIDAIGPRIASILSRASRRKP
jgi:two-component system response regulator WspF